MTKINLKKSLLEQLYNCNWTHVYRKEKID